MKKNKFYFITNRNIDNPDMTKWDDVTPDINCGEFEVKPYFNQYKINPFTFYIGTEKEKLDILFSKVSENVILFIHGFATNADDSFIDCQKIHNNIQTDHDIIVLSWASNGKVNAKDYLEDQEDARKSGEFIAYVFDYLLTKNKNITLICHSMGNYVFQNGWQVYQARPIPYNTFKNIIMVAADVDYDCFNTILKLQDCDVMSHRIIIFYNQKDTVLKYSDLAFKNNLPRLGQRGVRDKFVLNEYIKQIDITDDIKLHCHNYLLNKGNVEFFKKLKKYL